MNLLNMGHACSTSSDSTTLWCAFRPVCCPWYPQLFYEMLVNRSEVSLLDLDEYMPSPGLWDWFGRTDSYRVHDVFKPFLFVHVIVFSWDTHPFCLGWFQIRKVGCVLECPTSNVDIDSTSRLGSGKRHYFLLFSPQRIVKNIWSGIKRRYRNSNGESTSKLIYKPRSLFPD